MCKRQHKWKQCCITMATVIMCGIGVLSTSDIVCATTVPAYDYTLTDATNTVNGADKAADTKGLQSLLDKAIGSERVVTIYLPSGTYYVEHSLKVYSNTHIILHKDATIRRMDSAVDDMIIHNVDQNGKMDQVGGYDMSKNITIEGGTWDGGNIKLATDGTDLIRFDHAENITVKNLSVKNVYDCHLIEYVGVKNGLIDNCKFKGFRYKKGKTTDYTYAREAIQLDSAWTTNENDLSDLQAAWANGSVIDGTSCKQVTVSNNTFVDMPCGVGQHRYTSSGKYRNEDITITKNTFTCASSMKYCKIAITASGTNRLTITDNTIKGPYRFSVHVLAADDVTIENNTIENIKMNGLMIDKGSVTAIKNNTITSAKKHGISVGGGTVGEISGNTITSAGINGISLDDGTVTVISNNIIKTPKKHGISVAGKTKKSTGAKITDITDNVISKAKQNGITVDVGKITNISNNKITSPGKSGISIAGKTSGKKGGTIKYVANNTISKAKVNGITMDKGKVTSIQNNKITNSGQHGISIIGGSVGSGEKKTQGVLNNTIKTCKGNGITVSGNAKVSAIASNKITSVKNNGISLTLKAKVQYIIKNTIKKCSKHGIWNGTSTKTKISGNKGKTE